MFIRRRVQENGSLATRVRIHHHNIYLAGLNGATKTVIIQADLIKAECCLIFHLEAD